VPEVRLTDEEAQVMRDVLRRLVIRTRTGEVGIVHGMERFVSSQAVLKRKELETLDSAARKLGLGGGVKRVT
jgi:hypothetical protein